MENRFRQVFCPLVSRRVAGRLIPVRTRETGPCFKLDSQHEGTTTGGNSRNDISLHGSPSNGILRPGSSPATRNFVTGSRELPIEAFSGETRANSHREKWSLKFHRRSKRNTIPGLNGGTPVLIKFYVWPRFRRSVDKSFSEATVLRSDLEIDLEPRVTIGSRPWSGTFLSRTRGRSSISGLVVSIRGWIVSFRLAG